MSQKSISYQSVIVSQNERLYMSCFAALILCNMGLFLELCWFTVMSWSTLQRCHARFTNRKYFLFNKGTWLNHIAVRMRRFPFKIIRTIVFIKIKFDSISILSILIKQVEFTPPLFTSLAEANLFYYMNRLTLL